MPTHTSVYEFLNGVVDADDIYPAAEHNKIVDAIEAVFVRLAEMIGGGFVAATDFNVTTPGGLVAQVSGGTGIIGGANARKIVYRADTQTISDLVANKSQVAFYVNRSSGAVTVVYDGGAAPSNSMLAATASTTADAVTNINNAPIGRVNLGGLLTALRAFDNETLEYDSVSGKGRVKDGGITGAKVADATLTEGKLAFEPVRDPGRKATGHIRLPANPADGDTVTVTVAGTAVTYEFDSNNNVGINNIAVTIGADASATASALQAAIAANSADITAVVHTTDTSVIDLRCDNAGDTLTLDATGTTVVQNNGGELTPADRYLYTVSRTVTAEDVARGRVRVDTGLADAVSWLYRIRTAEDDNTEVAYSGAVSRYGGVFEFDASDLAAGNVIDLWVFGL